MQSVSIEQSVEPGLQADQRLLDRSWLRIGAGAAIAAQAMVFSLAVNLSEISGWAYAVVHGILIVSAAGALAFLGGDLVSSAWDSIRERKISIDLLFLVTLLGAFIGSLISTFTSAGSVYYEVVAILIVVHTSGKMLGARSRVAALRAVDETREKFEWCDVVQVDGSVLRISARNMQAGLRIRVGPGGAIAADGKIITGRGYVQETSMTGEWRPEPRGPGDRVLAGTFSVDGSFEILASGGARKLDAILEVVSHARLAPSRLQQQADKLMAWFLPLVVSVSFATFTFWIARGPWERALFNAMAVLLVACPCAMGLATPVAVWGGLARLAQFGLVARTGDFLDVLSRVDMLCIDKTGTLSEDALSVQAWQIEQDFIVRESWLRTAVAKVEEGLPHPVAEALRKDCQVPGDGISKLLAVGERRIMPGLGVVAEIIGTDGNVSQVAVGELALGRLLANDRFPVSEQDNHIFCDDLPGKALHIFVDGKRAATVVLEERWRVGLDKVFEELSGLGIETEVLSGDPSAAKALGTVTTIRAGLTPTQKQERVEACVHDGRTVLFVGDGINDAAAMSAAQASIAMRGGAELARASAMAVFAGTDLHFLPLAIGLARAVLRSIRTNLLFAASYNVVGMGLAAAGVLHPVAAALLMLGSSVFVSVAALRSGRDWTKNVAR